jgi:hypothetical protein
MELGAANASKTDRTTRLQYPATLGRHLPLPPSPIYDELMLPTKQVLIKNAWEQGLDATSARLLWGIQTSRLESGAVVIPAVSCFSELERSHGAECFLCAPPRVRDSALAERATD